MIFAHTLDKVLRGEKWQTRRLVKPGEIFDTLTGRAAKSNQRTLYQVGKSYAVQPNRGKRAVARITLTGLRREAVGAISDDDARAEGFSSRKDFIAAWRQIHGQETSLEAEVWVLEFQLCSIAVELPRTYERSLRENRSIDHGDDIPAALTGISGTGMHSGHYAGW